MKVLLYNPRSGGNELFNLGLMYIAAMIKKDGHKVIICDGDQLHDLNKYILSFKPDVFCASGMTPFIESIYEICRLLHKKNVFTIIGGHHVSALPEEAIGYADAVVVGEGEEVICDIINNKSKGIFNGGDVDVNKLPFPAYELIDVNFYCQTPKRVYNTLLGYVPMEHRVTTISNTRGCPYKCTYCHNSSKNSKLRMMKPERVVDELKFLVKKYKLNCIHFHDDDFFFSANRIAKICDLMKEEKIKVYWSANARATDVTEEKVKIAKEHGLVCLTFGFESTSNRILEILNKKQTYQDIINAVSICKKHDLIIQSGFMFGNPTEYSKEMINSAQFCLDNRLDGSNGAFITVPYPGTTMWKYCKENKLISPNARWNQFQYQSPFIEMSDVPLPKLNNFVNSIRHEFSNLFYAMFDERQRKVTCAIKTIKELYK